MITIHWKALLAALFIFAAGIAVGVFGTVGFGLRQIRTSFREPAAAGRLERATPRLEKRLTDELALDDAQTAIVHRELTRAAQDLRAIRVETVRRTRRTVADTVLRIGAELPPEKRAQLRQLARKRLERLGLELPLDDGAAAPQP